MTNFKGNNPKTTNFAWRLCGQLPLSSMAGFSEMVIEQWTRATNEHSGWYVDNTNMENLHALVTFNQVNFNGLEKLKCF